MTTRNLPLDIYDEFPKCMRKYLQHYGWHFNKELCEFAVSGMIKGDKHIEPITKEFVDKLLSKYDIELTHNVGWDYVFVANMCKADYYHSSIDDEHHFALYIKDTIDDEDAAEGTTMRRWYATMVGNGIIIDWSEFV